jgi:hypothetical protein
MIHALGLLIWGRILRGSYSTGGVFYTGRILRVFSLLRCRLWLLTPRVSRILVMGLSFLRYQIEEVWNHEQDGVCTDDVSETSSRCATVSTFNVICLYTFQECRSSNGVEVWYFKIDSGTIRHDTSLAVFSIMYEDITYA